MIADGRACDRAEHRPALAAQVRDQLERLCRYVARPAVAERRLSISSQDRVRYELKTRWKKGATHVEFQPVEFVATLAAPVPQPRAHR
jgi:hypothetical protein